MLATAPHRRSLPRSRRSVNFKFEINNLDESYLTVGEYEDGCPGEIFIRAAKQGSTLAGVMDALSAAVSLGLQHGVPLSEFVKEYQGTKFEPAGATNWPELPTCSSIIDLIFRHLARHYLASEERKRLGLSPS